MTHTAPAPPASPVAAVLPLAVLEAVRGLDMPTPDALDEFHGELTAKRLGLNRTVAVQIERLARLGDRGRVPADELAALLRLVARRNDAGLVFSEAGRRAAHYAARRLPWGARGVLGVLPAGLRRPVGFALARRLAERVVGLRLERDGGVATARVVGAGRLPPERGSACAFYGSAVAELLRLFTDFEGAMMHVACVARGDAACEWRGALAHG